MLTWLEQLPSLNRATPDTRNQAEILDLAQRLDAALQDAERRGIIVDADRDDVVGLFC